MLEPTSLDEALHTLGAVLQGRGHTFEIVSVGGSSLLLLGLTTRATRDLDIVAIVRDGTYVAAEPLPGEHLQAVRDVGDALPDVSDSR